MTRWHKQQRGQHVLRGQEELQGVWDPSGGNRSGDSRWLPDPRVPSWLTGGGRQMKKKKKKKKSHHHSVIRQLIECAYTVGPVAMDGWILGEDGSERSFFTANLLMWNITLLVGID